MSDSLILIVRFLSSFSWIISTELWKTCSSDLLTYKKVHLKGVVSGSPFTVALIFIICLAETLPLQHNLVVVSLVSFALEPCQSHMCVLYPGNTWVLRACLQSYLSLSATILPVVQQSVYWLDLM